MNTALLHKQITTALGTNVDCVSAPWTGPQTNPLASYHPLNGATVCVTHYAPPTQQQVAQVAGVVAAFVDAPPTITAAQFWQQAVAGTTDVGSLCTDAQADAAIQGQGFTGKLLAALNGQGEGQKKKTLVAFRKEHLDINDPAIVAFATALGWTQQQLAAFWAAAAQLT